MTIEKGESWGAAHEGPPPGLVAADDADLARLAHGNRSPDLRPEILVGPGDVAATIGADSASLPGTDDRAEAPHHRYPMDLGYVALGRRDGEVERTVPFAAHVMGHRSPWPPQWPLPRSWPELIIMNTPLASGLRLGPRAHPNDGLLDITVGTLPWRQAREARRRAGAGGHLPHPRLETRRRAEEELTPEHRLWVTIDGVDHGRWSRLSVSVVPDAYILVAPLR